MRLLVLAAFVAAAAAAEFPLVTLSVSPSSAAPNTEISISVSFAALSSASATCGYTASSAVVFGVVPQGGANFIQLSEGTMSNGCISGSKIAYIPNSAQAGTYHFVFKIMSGPGSDVHISASPSDINGVVTLVNGVSVITSFRDSNRSILDKINSAGVTVALPLRLAGPGLQLSRMLSLSASTSSELVVALSDDVKQTIAATTFALDGVTAAAAANGVVVSVAGCDSAQIASGRVVLAVELHWTSVVGGTSADAASEVAMLALSNALQASNPNAAFERTLAFIAAGGNGPISVDSSDTIETRR